MATEYRVIDIDGNTQNEWHHTVTSDARTVGGFFRLFYNCFPKAPRGNFYVEVGDARADVYARDTNRKVAIFIAK